MTPEEHKKIFGEKYETIVNLLAEYQIFDLYDLIFELISTYPNAIWDLNNSTSFQWNKRMKEIADQGAKLREIEVSHLKGNKVIEIVFRTKFDSIKICDETLISDIMHQIEKGSSRTSGNKSKRKRANSFSSSFLKKTVILYKTIKTEKRIKAITVRFFIAELLIVLDFPFTKKKGENVNDTFFRFQEHLRIKYRGLIK